MRREGGRGLFTPPALHGAAAFEEEGEEVEEEEEVQGQEAGGG